MGQFSLISWRTSGCKKCTVQKPDEIPQTILDVQIPSQYLLVHQLNQSFSSTSSRQYSQMHPTQNQYSPIFSTSGLWSWQSCLLFLKLAFSLSSQPLFINVPVAASVQQRGEWRGKNGADKKVIITKTVAFCYCCGIQTNGYYCVTDSQPGNKEVKWGPAAITTV